MKTPVAPVNVLRKNATDPEQDLLAVEEPLQIKLLQSGNETDLVVTMRTPGHDFELVTGFLYSEGLITGVADIEVIRYCEQVEKEAHGNVIKVTPAVEIEKAGNRNFYANSSCGVCGKTNIDEIREACEVIPELKPFSVPIIERAADSLKNHQDVFAHTGGLHACAAVDRSGRVVLAREDIGRHNALDKLVGAALGEGLAPMHDFVLLLSGRASFEMIQKAVRAGFPVVASIGAPSNLAVEVAAAQNMALLGFVRDNNFNIYTGKERIEG